MAKLLILGEDPRGGNWRLPAETDIDELKRNIGACMTDGKVLHVTVEMGNDPLQRGTVFLNGRTLDVAAVVELEEPDNTLRSR